MAQGLRERPRVVAATVLLVATFAALSMLVGAAIGDGSDEELAVERAAAEAELQDLRQQLDASEQRIGELERQLAIARESVARHARRGKLLERRLETLERARSRPRAERGPRRGR